MRSLRFADPQLELDFRRGERTKAGARVRVLMLIGGAVIASEVMLNPFMGAHAGDSTGVTLIALGFAVLIAASFPATRAKVYIEHPVADFALSFLLALLLALLYSVMTAHLPGFPDEKYWMFVSFTGITLVLTSAVFAAAFWYFATWAIAVAAGAAAYLFVMGQGALDVLEYLVIDEAVFFGFSLYSVWDREVSARRIFAAHAELAAERQKTETLLYNVLPQSVASRLKAGEAVADAFGNVSVIFVDMVGFSTLSKVLSPGHLVELLNSFFTTIDQCAERHRVEKVKTIGDAYLAVAGGMASGVAGSVTALSFAKDVIVEVGKLADQPKVRVGIHTGPVVGGVIGTNRMVYDYWGDTMNIASRLEGSAPENGIAVSEATYHQTKGVHAFHPPQTMLLKGIGEMQVYFAAMPAEVEAPVSEAIEVAR